MAGDRYDFVAARALPATGGGCYVARNDDPTKDEYQNASTDAYGTNIDFHQTGDGMAPGAQIIIEDFGDAAGNLVAAAGTTRDSSVLQAYLAGSRFHNMSYGTPTPPTSYEFEQYQ